MASKTLTATFERKTARGDWFATLPVEAFGDDAEGPYAYTVDGQTTVRFGARAGAMIQAMPEKRRVEVIVASVLQMRATMETGEYKNDARPGAIPSPVVSLATRIASTIAEGAAVRATLGRIPASRRVAAAPVVAAKAAEKFGTTAEVYEA